MILIIILYVVGLIYSAYRFFTEPDYKDEGFYALGAMILFWPAFLVVDIALHGLRRK